MSFLLSKLGNWLVSSDARKRKEHFIAQCKAAIEASKNGNYEAACRLWKEITEKNPRISGIWNSWGVDLGKWGDLGGPDAKEHYHEASKKFQKATEIDPDNDEAFYNWGITFSNLAEFGGQQSEEFYRQACEKYQKAADIIDN